MDVIKVGTSTIDFFEDAVIYLRAMEVRLSIAYSYILVRKLKEAEYILERVDQFATSFNAKYLLEDSNLLYATLYLMKLDITTAQEYLNKTTKKTSYHYYLQMKLDISNNDLTKALETYMKYKHDDNCYISDSQKDVMKSMLYNYKIIEMNDSEYLKCIEHMIAYGVKGLDLQLIDAAYNYLTSFYTERRMYKKAYEASEIAREYRRYGDLSRKND